MATGTTQPQKTVPAQQSKDVKAPAQPAPAQKKSDVNFNWFKVSAKLPDIKTKINAIHSVSGLLLIRTKNNGISPGFFVRLNSDFNQPHIERKKGDTYFVNMTDEELKDVEEYYPVNKI